MRERIGRFATSFFCTAAAALVGLAVLTATEQRLSAAVPAPTKCPDSAHPDCVGTCPAGEECKIGLTKCYCGPR